MKKYPFFLIVATFAAMLGMNVKVQAQNSNGCSAGAALGKTHAAFASCLSGYHASYEIGNATSPNQYGGYTATVYAQPKCPPQAICPLYIFNLGSLETDNNCDVVNVFSACR